LARIGVDLAEIASLMGDVARAHMLTALMDGRALTALELALTARVTPQTASSHLGKLREANLLAMEKQGRHRYFRLASPRVAEALESVLTLAGDGPPRHRPPTRIDEEMRTARTCYDHVAGVLGVGDRRRCRRGDGDGCRFSDAAWRRPGAARKIAPHLLPAVPRLERASPAFGRTCRRGFVRAFYGRGLGAANAREPRAKDHAARAREICRDVRRGAARDRSAAACQPCGGGAPFAFASRRRACRIHSV
jgi:DNA-binding transcriptional ArsR family regulator